MSISNTSILTTQGQKCLPGLFTAMFLVPRTVLHHKLKAFLLNEWMDD